MSLQSTTFTSVTAKISAIDLVWNRLPGAPSRSFFTIQYSTNDGNSWITYPTRINGTMSSITISSLNPNLFYIFRISVTNIFGTGPYSAQTSPVKPLTATPSVPLNFTAISDKGSIKLDWTQPSNIGATPITEYKVEYSSNGGNSWIAINSIAQNIFSYTIPGLSNGSTYLCRVSAKNQNGFGPTTTPISVLVFSLPSPPLNFKGIFGNNSASVNWTPPVDNGGKDIVEYAIQCAAFSTLQQAKDFNPGQTTSPKPLSVTNFKFNNINNMTSVVVPNLTNGLFYSLRIRAFNIPGIAGIAGVVSSLFSNKIIIRPRTIPEKPTNLQIIGLGNASVSLSWDAPTNTGGIEIPLLYYTIQYNNGNNWITYDSVVSNTSITINDLTIGQPYIFRVAVSNNVGISQYSDNSITVVPGSPPPDAPTNIQGVAKNKSVLLSWNAPSDTGGLPILNYTIQQSVDNGSTWSLYAGGSTATNSILITGLTNNLQYKFRVSATNVVGTGPYSTASSAITPQATVPQKPTLLKAVASDSKAILNWQSPSDDGGSVIISYKIQKSSNSGSTWTDVVTINSSNISYTINNLINDTTYIFKVAAINAIGTGAYSDNSNAVTPIAPQILFDNSQLDDILQFNIDIGAIQSKSPWKEYILEASNRLSKYIKYKNSVVQAIRNRGGGWSSWNGAYPSSINWYYEENGPWVASCGLEDFNTDTYGLPGVQANTIRYFLEINTFYQNYFDHSNWVDIITHELCHGLGLGIYWNYNQYPNVQGSVKPINNLLDGTAYTQTQAAYNAITGLVRYKVPLESKGVSLQTASAHWEDEPRVSSAVSYYGVWDELMIGYAPRPGEKHILSRLTLKHLVDLGYEEINPGASEGDPEVNTNRTYNIDNNLPRIRMNCACHPINTEE